MCLRVGCFGPCLCPVQLGQALRGTFVLTEAPGPPASPFRDFDVKGITWFVDLGGQTVPRRGGEADHPGALKRPPRGPRRGAPGTRRPSLSACRFPFPTRSG